MLKFKMSEKPIDIKVQGIDCKGWEIYQFNPIYKLFAIEVGNDNDKRFNSVELAKAVAGDRVAIMNLKYIDKEINAEWPKINRIERIKEHKEQLELLESDKNLVWNSEGYGVKSGFD